MRVALTWGHGIVLPETTILVWRGCELLRREGWVWSFRTEGEPIAEAMLQRVSESLWRGTVKVEFPNGYEKRSLASAYPMDALEVALAECRRGYPDVLTMDRHPTDPVPVTDHLQPDPEATLSWRGILLKPEVGFFERMMDRTTSAFVVWSFERDTEQVPFSSIWLKHADHGWTASLDWLNHNFRAFPPSTHSPREILEDLLKLASRREDEEGWFDLNQWIASTDPPTWWERL